MWDNRVVFAHSSELEKVLAEWSQHGWQLVAVTLDSDDSMYSLFFKRKAQQ
jgi:hypothetical protein